MTAARLNAWFIVTRGLALLLAVIPPLATVSFPLLIQRSDYLTAFYVAGAVLAHGQMQWLYPAASDQSFFTTQFNQYAHRLLPELPPNHTAIYMYSPLIALVMAPLSLVPPAVSLAIWQILNIVAVAAGALLVCGRTNKAETAICFAFLFLPVFHTILIGQLGVAWGLLPACAGLHFMLKNRHFAAGLCWSLLLLKPQFIPLALLVCAAQALNRRFHSLGGLLAGSIGLAAIAALAVSPDVCLQWLHSFRLSDTIFSDPRYGYPRYMVSCLPGAVVQALPQAMRPAGKIVMYCLAAAIGLATLAVAFRLLKRDQSAKTIGYVCIIGVLVLPLVVPHMLFYDLCILALAGFIIIATQWTDHERLVLYVNGGLVLLLLNAYYILCISPLMKFAQPLVLVALLAAVYVKVCWDALRLD